MSYEEFSRVHEERASERKAASLAYSRQIETKATIFGACAALVLFFASTIDQWLAALPLPTIFLSIAEPMIFPFVAVTLVAAAYSRFHFKSRKPAISELSSKQDHLILYAVSFILGAFCLFAALGMLSEAMLAFQG